MLSEMSILFLVSQTCYSFIVLQCFESLFESMRTQMGADSAPTQQKNLAPGKKPRVFLCLGSLQNTQGFPR